MTCFRCRLGRAAAVAGALLLTVWLFAGCTTPGRPPGATGVTVNRDAARDVEPTVLVDGRVRTLRDSDPAGAVTVREAALRSITRRRLEAAGFELTQPAELLVRIYVGRYDDWRGRPYARVEVHAYRYIPNQFRPQLVWQLWLQERIEAEAQGPAAADYERLLRALLDPGRLRELRRGS